MNKERARQVFVAMPFAGKHDAVFAAIEQASKIANLQPRRVDKEEFAGSIIAHIFSAVESADFMVAVVSEENGNVYYEIGLAHCQKKPVVLLTSETKALKFDLAQ